MKSTEPMIGLDCASKPTQLLYQKSFLYIRHNSTHFLTDFSSKRRQPLAQENTVQLGIHLYFVAHTGKPK